MRRASLDGADRVIGGSSSLRPSVRRACRSPAAAPPFESGPPRMSNFRSKQVGPEGDAGHQATAGSPACRELRLGLGLELGALIDRSGRSEFGADSRDLGGYVTGRRRVAEDAAFPLPRTSRDEASRLPGSARAAHRSLCEPAPHKRLNKPWRGLVWMPEQRMHGAVKTKGSLRSDEQTQIGSDKWDTDVEALIHCRSRGLARGSVGLLGRGNDESIRCADCRRIGRSYSRDRRRSDRRRGRCFRPLGCFRFPADHLRPLADRLPEGRGPRDGHVRGRVPR